MNYYASVITDPGASDYMKVVMIGRVEIGGDSIITERWDVKQNKWVDDPTIFGRVTGLEDGLDFHEINQNLANGFIAGKNISLNTFEGHLGRPGQRGGSLPRDETAGDIFDQLKNSPDGFSYRPASKGAPSSGFMTSMEDGPIFDPSTSEDEALGIIQKFLDEKADLLKQDDYYVGGWLNSKDGKFYLDASKNFQDLHETLYEASGTHQKGIFDINNLNTIWVGDWLAENPNFEAPPGAREWYIAHPEKE